MSFNVLVIPEDPTLNGYILKPLVEAVAADADKPNAHVTILANPHLNGYDTARAAISEGRLDGKYRHFNLWLFMPDADRAKKDSMDDLERQLDSRKIRLICCPAIPEVEIYACVAYRDEIDWQQARASRSMKEDFFEKLLAQHGAPKRPGGGRDLMIASSLKNRQKLYTSCPELKGLRDRIKKGKSS